RGTGAAPRGPRGARRAHRPGGGIQRSPGGGLQGVPGGDGVAQASGAVLEEGRARDGAALGGPEHARLSDVMSFAALVRRRYSVPTAASQQTGWREVSLMPRTMNDIMHPGSEPDAGFPHAPEGWSQAV